MSRAKLHSRVIFGSVFPDGSQPLRNATEPKQKSVIGDIILTLQRDSRAALGITDVVKVLDRTLIGVQELEFIEPIGHSREHQRLDFLHSCSSLKSWQLVAQLKSDSGTAKIRKAFAEIIDVIVTEYVYQNYTGSHSHSVTAHLKQWVNNTLLVYVSGFLNMLKGQQVTVKYFNKSQEQKWHDMALTRLATLRTTELFDVIVDWDNTVAVVDDLKQFTTNPATRSFITSSFSDALTTRLLHPGAATIEILTVYISVIRAFRRLDPRGVLLERVARKIRRYLRDREDTIKVVVSGLLANPAVDNSNQEPDILRELADELHQRTSHTNNISETDLDYNNMDWQPDPIDAAPDYTKSKSTDVLGSIITLFDSKDIFIKELQVALSERLLKNKLDFDQEMSVIEHLKIRFGDAALQACEVMLRDVLDSRKVDQVIRTDQAMDQADESSNVGGVQFHTKILSRLFWPPLQEQNFNVPIPIQHQQNIYEKGFENLKQTRKLSWLNAIGQVEIELELEDRTYHDEVLPWQASVIYAFQDAKTSPASRSVKDLSEELQMTLALVRSACMFWSSHRILKETSRDEFTVLETLPLDTDNENNISSARQDADSAAAEIAAAQAAREAEEAERRQKMSLYHQFIISMLTNQGAMPLPRIAMMLGMVVPGGFPFGNEELKEFMDGMVKDGVLEVSAGGSYKVVK